MALVPAICTQCGAKIVVDNKKDAAICQYCETPFVVEKAINNYNVTNNINAQIVNIINNENNDFEIVAGVLKNYKGSAVDVVIPEGVLEIGPSATFSGVFKGCSSLRSVQLPESLKKIGPFSFENCSSLISIKIPDSVTNIGERAFSGCTGLVDVVLSNTLKEIANSAFAGCKSLEKIEIPSSVEKIKGLAFSQCTSLKSITIPESVIDIEYKHEFATRTLKLHPFLGCTSLSEICFPERFSKECFRGSKWFDDLQKMKADIRKRICPICKCKLSIFGNKCKKCGQKY